MPDKNGVQAFVVWKKNRPAADSIFVSSAFGFRSSISAPLRSPPKSMSCHCPLLSEIGLDGMRHLIVVVANRLELFVEFRQADVVVHRRLVDFHYLDLSAEDCLLDEKCPVPGLCIGDQLFKTRVLLGVQTETILVVRQDCSWAFCLFLFSILPSYTLGYWVRTLSPLFFLSIFYKPGGSLASIRLRQSKTSPSATNLPSPFAWSIFRSLLSGFSHTLVTCSITNPYLST